MVISEMSRGECDELLARLCYGRLACAYKNQPYVVPTYFTYDAGRLYAFSTMGKKIEWMRSNPLVCVEADEVKDRDQWVSVVVRGRYQEIPDTPKYEKLRREMETVLDETSRWWQTGFASGQTRGQSKQDVPVLYYIEIEEITGHRASPDPAPVSIG